MSSPLTGSFDRDLLGLDELVELAVLALLDGRERVGQVVEGQDGDVEGPGGAAGTLENDAANVVVPGMKNTFVRRKTTQLKQVSL